MAEITAQAVNEFRKKTGLGLMECKTLLKEADGDMKKAETLAKERGLKNAEKRSGRAASAGRLEVAFSPDHKSGAIVELNCETDFVARNDEFRRMAKDLAEQILATGAEGDLLDQPFHKAAGKTIREALVELNAKMGENVSIARSARFSATPAGRVDAYVHHDAKSGALVELDTEDDATAGAEGVKHLAKELAMQVVAANPVAVRRDEVSPTVVEEQRRIFIAQAADKPEQIRGKIADGKLNSWYAESVLLDQALVKDPGKTVNELVKAAGGKITVARFARYVVGETATGTTD